MSDQDHDLLETRLLVVAEMLDKAVLEVRRVMDSIRADPTRPLIRADSEENRREQ